VLCTPSYSGFRLVFSFWPNVPFPLIFSFSFSLTYPFRLIFLSTLKTALLPYLQMKTTLITPVCVFTVVQIMPIAISNISWHTFIIFAVFCALWVPIVYCFFPETNQLKLEDIDHLFERGGVTGGVFRAKGGRTVEPGFHERVRGVESVEKGVGFGSEHLEGEKRV
jgi:hypothetical protein